MGHIRIGTCSWADKTMVEAWYPPDAASSAEARLRYYADRFDTVEADSPYYGIPPLSTTTNWARRTPEGFTFHVKAYGLMTGHAVDERSLHPGLRDYRYGLSARGRVYEPEPAMLERTFELFREAMAPLRDAGRLGGVLMQYPSSFAARDAAETTEGLERIARDHALLRDCPMLVEFRNATWVEDSRRGEVLGFLADEGITFVTVDAPRDVGVSAMPTVPAVTSRIAYVRFHGRNRDTWGLQTKTAADRFDYLYERDELAEWSEPLHEMSDQADATFAMFNNCRFDYAPRNGQELAEILGAVSMRPDGLLPGDPHPDHGPAVAHGQNLTLDI
jgi:uncharacterized protein YecE (DUF72 family)